MRGRRALASPLRPASPRRQRPGKANVPVKTRAQRYRKKFFLSMTPEVVPGSWMETIDASLVRKSLLISPRKAQVGQRIFLLTRELRRPDHLRPSPNRWRKEWGVNGTSFALSGGPRPTDPEERVVSEIFGLAGGALPWAVSIGINDSQPRAGGR